MLTDISFKETVLGKTFVQQGMSGKSSWNLGTSGC